MDNMKTFCNIKPGLFILIGMSLLFFMACSKKKKNTAVVTNTSALTATQKLEAAIDARVGVFKIIGTVDTAVYLPSDIKTISISKISPSKIRITANNFSMGVFEFDVQNGATVSNGVVSGSDDGKAIGYSGPSPLGQIIFSCDESDNMALVVAGVGINSVSISGTK
jgi:hypothetical protein